jgi:hypothetical protein
MWILSFVPNELLQLAVFAIIAIGAILYVLSLLTGFIKPLAPYKEPIRIIATAFAIAGVYFYGSYSTEMDWRKRVEEAQAKVAIAEEQSKTANAKIDNKIQTRTRVVHDVQVVVKERIKEIAVRADAECKVDPEIVKSLNKAAVGTKDGQ